MSVLQTIPETEATGRVAEWYREDIDEIGHIASHTKAMALNPEAQLAFEALIKAVYPSLGPRRYELVTLAAAGALRSEHCLLAHGRKSLRLFDEEQLTRIATDHHDAGLDEADVAMMDFAARVSRDPHAMTDADSLRLRERGFTDRQILDIALAAAADVPIDSSVAGAIGLAFRPELTNRFGVEGRQPSTSFWSAT